MGSRLGTLAKDESTVLVAKEVQATLIPPDDRRGLPAQWGIAIRCDSRLLLGSECWVNITRERASFARPVYSRRRSGPY